MNKTRMRKIGSLALVLTMLLTMVTALPADAETRETVIIDNVATAETKPTTGEFRVSETIKAAGTKNNIVVSSIANGRNAIALAGSDVSGKDKYVEWHPDAEKLSGRYRVSFYNIGAGTEKFLNSTTNEAIRDPYARYDIVTADGTVTKFVDQGTVTGTTDGWAELGVFAFAGDGDEYVRLTKTFGSKATADANATTYAYADSVKFEPVDEENANLIHIYAVADGAAINTEETEPEAVTEVRVPEEAESFTLTLVAESEAAQISVNGGAASHGKAVITGAPLTTGMGQYTIQVTNGVAAKEYVIKVDFERAYVIDESSGEKDYATLQGTVDEASETFTLKDIDGYEDFTKIIYTTNNSALTVPWNVTVPEVGNYNLYAYAMVYSVNSTAVNAKELEIQVQHNGETTSKSVEWAKYGLRGAWVYVGRYEFSGQGTETITFLHPKQSGRITIAGYKLAKSDIGRQAALASMTANGAAVEVSTLNGAILEAEDTGKYEMTFGTTSDTDVINVAFNGKAVAKNYESGTYSPENLKNGINSVKITVTAADDPTNKSVYAFTLIARAHVMYPGDAEYDAESWKTYSVPGYNDTTYLYNSTNGLSATYKVNQDVMRAKGKTDIYYWFVNFTNNPDTAAKLTINGESEMTISFETTASTRGKWIKIGTYFFEGKSDESITLSQGTENMKIVLGCIKLVNADEVIFETPQILKNDAAIEEVETGALTASVTYYAEAARENVLLIFAEYKNGNQLAGISIKDYTLKAGVDTLVSDAISVTEVTGTKLKVFVWDGANLMEALTPKFEL